MFQVSKKGRVVDEYIVEENNHKLSQEWPEEVIHGFLESGYGIGQAEGHYRELIMTVVGVECCFWDILIVHANLVEPLPEVQLGEPRSITDLVQ